MSEFLPSDMISSEERAWKHLKSKFRQMSKETLREMIADLEQELGMRFG